MQGYSSILLIVIMIALMYFMMIRPQQKQRSKHQDMVNQLKKGDRVVTIGRLHGVIDEVNTANKTVVLDCEGIYLTFDLAAIASVNPGTPATADAPASDSVAESAEASSDTAEEQTDAAEEPASEDSSENNDK